VRVIHEVAAFSAALDEERRAGRTVGFVPTMGALHDGHASLVARAAQDCDVVATSIFVNPLQFGANEDLDAYPRTLDADVQVVERAGGSIVFAPSVTEMYGEGTWTTVSVGGGMTAVLEGASRPGHFDGVATVVAKLFAMAGTCRAYFGEKDWQQLAIVKRMAADLSFPVTVVPCATVRADDGLALSSRNAYLSAEERTIAPALHRALRTGADLVEAGETDPDVVEAAMAAVLAEHDEIQPEYAVVVHSATMEHVRPLQGDLRLLVAARLPSARLIDNLGVTLSGTHRRDN
jgi:pantoate--beta-alanine ligase